MEHKCILCEEDRPHIHVQVETYIEGTNIAIYCDEVRILK